MILLPGFLYFWGIVFFVTTTLVGIFKPERADPDVDPEQGIVDTYKILLDVIRLPSVLSYALILLTAKVSSTGFVVVGGKVFVAVCKIPW